MSRATLPGEPEPDLVCESVPVVMNKGGSTSQLPRHHRCYSRAVEKEILVWLTRILYFPVLTLSLYKREWFPGEWVLIPMALNSLIWVLGIYCGIVFARNFTRTR